MADIIIETKNKKKMSITKGQLYELAANGQISPDTKLWYNGKETVCKNVKGLVFQTIPVPPINNPASSPLRPIPQQNENKPESKNKNIMIIGFSMMGLLVLILAGMVIYLAGSRSDNTPVSTPVPAPSQNEVAKKEITGKIPEPEMKTSAPEAAPNSSSSPSLDTSPVSDEKVHSRSDTNTIDSSGSPSDKSNEHPTTRNTSSGKKSSGKTVDLKPGATRSAKNPGAGSPAKGAKMDDVASEEDIPSDQAHISFNEEIEVLPPNFRPMEIDDVYNAIFLMDFKKTSLETKSEYQERLRAKMQEKFLGDLTLLSTFAVHYKDNMGYNADKEQIYLTVPQITQYTPEFGVKVNRFNMQIKAAVEDKGTYRAQNGYGAKVDVEESLLECFTLITPSFRINRPRINLGSLNEEERRIPMKMTREKAQEANGAIACLVIFKLAPVLRTDEDNPFITFDIFRKKPKFHSPSDIKMRNLGLLAKDISLWYYNENTGEIYYKFTLRDIANKVSR